MAITLNGTTGITTPALDSSGPLTSLGIDDNATSTAITIDASQNVGIGTASPSTQDVSANNLVVEDIAGNGGITIKTPTSAYGSLHFSDGTGVDAYRGALAYNHADNTMQFSTNATERMKIDSAGYVTKPYHPVASFSVSDGPISYATNQDVFAGKTTLVRALQGITYTSATGRFTVPVGGKYYIHFFSMKSGTVTAYFNVTINGAETAGLRIYNASGSTNWSPYGLGGIVTLAANDWINVICSSSETNNAHGQSHLNFTAYLIG